MEHSFDILEFLEDQDGFVNEHGVSFIAIDDLVHLSTPLSPEHYCETITIEICGLAEPAFFTSIFQCKSPADLHLITREGMWRLYDAGVCYVSCLVDEGHLGGEMEFRKNRQGTIAIDAEGQATHLIGTPLASFEDFAQYASQYFLLKSTQTKDSPLSS